MTSEQEKHAIVITTSTAIFVSWLGRGSQERSLATSISEQCEKANTIIIRQS